MQDTQFQRRMKTHGHLQECLRCPATFFEKVTGRKLPPFMKTVVTAPVTVQPYHDKPHYSRKVD